MTINTSRLLASAAAVAALAFAAWRVLPASAQIPSPAAYTAR